MSIGASMRLLEEANERGTTVVVVTHNKDIVNSMKKRVIHMNSGTIVEDIMPGGVIEEV